MLEVTQCCQNHHAQKILIDGREEKAKDTEGQMLPTLVYMAREKRPQHFHNFKVGAMNALIRVSSEISNAPIILNVDCDMYSNNSGSVQMGTRMLFQNNQYTKCWILILEMSRISGQELKGLLTVVRLCIKYANKLSSNDIRTFIFYFELYILFNVFNYVRMLGYINL